MLVSLLVRIIGVGYCVGFVWVLKGISCVLVYIIGLGVSIGCKILMGELLVLVS